MFTLEKRFLPHSGRRYAINQYGEIFDSSNTLIKTEDDGKDIKVEINWIFGKKKYYLGVLVFLTFKKIALPDHLWNNLIPLYIDGNYKNNNPSNIIYKFINGKLEVEGHPNFYYIPFYTNYGIDLTGKLININTNKEKSWYITKPVIERNSKGGYLATRIVNDFGNSSNVLRHRLMGLTFLDFPSNYSDMVINHKNGIPGDDNPDNLEWVSVSENNTHAVENGLCPNRTNPVLMKNLITNEIIRFDSIIACSKYLGYERDKFISYRLKYSPNKVFADMLLFKYDDGSDWPIIDLKNVKIVRNGIASDIMARNVFTGEIIIFNGAEQGEKVLGIKAETITRHARGNLLIPYNGYNFRYVVGGDKWPKHTERHLICYRNSPIDPPDAVIVKNIITEEETFYISRELAAKEFNISIARVWALANEGKVFNDKYIFSLFKLKEALRSN